MNITQRSLRARKKTIHSLKHWNNFTDFLPSCASCLSGTMLPFLQMICTNLHRCTRFGLRQESSYLPSTKHTTKILVHSCSFKWIAPDLSPLGSEMRVLSRLLSGGIVYEIAEGSHLRDDLNLAPQPAHDQSDGARRSHQTSVTSAIFLTKTVGDPARKPTQFVANFPVFETLTIFLPWQLWKCREFVITTHPIRVHMRTPDRRDGPTVFPRNPG